MAFTPVCPVWTDLLKLAVNTARGHFYTKKNARDEKCLYQRVKSQQSYWMEIFNIIHHHKYEANRISLMVSSKKRPKLFKVCCRDSVKSRAWKKISRVGFHLHTSERWLWMLGCWFQKVRETVGHQQQTAYAFSCSQTVSLKNTECFNAEPQPRF